MPPKVHQKSVFRGNRSRKAFETGSNIRACFDQMFSKHAVPRIDFQVHTDWTDGADSVAAMYAEAVVKRLTHICFTEHASERSDAWFQKFVAQVRALPKVPCRAWVGAETRVVDTNGNLGTSQNILDQCDLVLGSVHRFPNGKGGVYAFEEIARERAEAIEFEYLMALLENPAVSVLAHPFGICYRIYKISPSEEHIRTVIEKAAKAGTAFEINAYYHPDPWRFIRWCREAGASISLGSDAHSRKEVGAIVKILEEQSFVWSR